MITVIARRTSNLLAAAILLAASQTGAAECGKVPPLAPFDAKQLSEHSRILSSDAFEGRAPASEGEKKTIAYLSEQFARFGLKPGGERGGWTQQVPLRRIELTEAGSLRFGSGAGAMELKNGDQAIFTSFNGDLQIDLRDVPLVFAGYGVSAPELGWNDFKGTNLKGKIAIVLVNDPDFETPTPGKFGGKSMTYYGRWIYKFEEAARQGALGALIVHEDVPAAYGWNTVQNSWGVPQIDIVRADPRSVHTPLRGWLRSDAALRLFERAGLDFKALKQRAQRADFKPVELKGVLLSAKASLHITPVMSYNVIGKIPGSKRPQESVVYSAHWDHLGIGRPDSNGDRIYNGGMDNATGVAGLLELARVFGSEPPTERSQYFVSFTAEERGLLGSEYYVLHPPSTLERTAAVFNMDLFAVAGAACDMSIWGDAKSDVQASLAAIVKGQGRTMTPDAHLEAGYFYRSDHFPFAKQGVPAITIMSGQNLYEGGLAAGKKAYDDYIGHRYHQAADQWTPDWNLEGVALDLTVMYRAGKTLASSAAWPQWSPGSEFKRVRDASAGARSSK